MFDTFTGPHQNLEYLFIDYNFLKTRTIAKKFWYVFELHRFVLHMKNYCCIVHRSLYRALRKFQYINIFCSFLMSQIGTKFYVFKLHRSDLHIKLVIVSSIYCFKRHFKNLFTLTFTISFHNVQHHYEISIRFNNPHICFIY